MEKEKNINGKVADPKARELGLKLHQVAAETQEFGSILLHFAKADQLKDLEFLSRKLIADASKLYGYIPEENLDSGELKKHMRDYVGRIMNVEEEIGRTADKLLHVPLGQLNYTTDLFPMAYHLKLSLSDFVGVCLSIAEAKREDFSFIPPRDKLEFKLSDTRIKAAMLLEKRI